MSSDMRLKLR